MRHAFLLLAILSPLSSCGFAPVYATPEARGTGGEASELQYVDIDQIPNRAGQELRNNLIAILPPGQGAARYRLEVKLSEAIDDFGIRRDTTATFARLAVTARYRLFERSIEKPILDGTVRAINSYNILASTFATLSAEEDARSRASEQLAQDIKLRLAAYFKGRSGP